MINKIIRNFIAKQVAGRSDDGIMISLKDPQKVEFQTAMMQELLMRRGIDPMAIQSEAQLNMIINRIKAMEKAEDAAQSGIKETESAKIFNRMGEELDPNKPIVGGTQTGKSIDTDTFSRLAETNTQRIKQRISDREKVRNEMKKKYGFTDERLNEIENTEIDEKLADDLLREDDERIIKERLEKQNKDSVQKILDRKNREDVYGLEDYDTTNMSDIKKEIIRTETKLGNLNPNTPGFRERAKPLIDKITALKNKLREDKADGGRIGFFMGSKFPKGLSALRKMLNYYGNKSDKVQYPSDILKIVNPKRLNTMLDDPNIYRKFDMQKGLAAPDMIKILQKQMMSERTKTIEEMLSSAKNIKKLDDDTLNYKNEMIEDMMKKGIDKKAAEKMADTISEMAESAGLGEFKNTPKLTDEGILELENILKNMETGGKDKRSLNADGGRIGLKDGMNRRTFLKLLGGLASIPIIGKIVKPLKLARGVKNVPIIKTGDVPGKPEWFDQLINKVIIEGDDVTKQLSTVEREIVHPKKINNTDEVTVYQDLNTDSVRVEYKSPNNMFEDQVNLDYIKTPADEGTPKGLAEFEVTESGIVGRADGPADYSMDVEEVGGTSIKDLDSDVSALKEFATGEKQTLKEFVQSKKRKDKVKRLNEGDPDETSQYVVDRQGDYVPEPDDYASGGLAGLLGE